MSHLPALRGDAGRVRMWRSLTTALTSPAVAWDAARQAHAATWHLERAGERGARVLRRLCRDLCRHHRLAVMVEGEIPHRPVVLVANHLGYLDPLAILSVIPALPVAKAEVAEWPIVGARAREAGVLFVRRGCAHSGAQVLLGARRALRAGTSILNFPEGTTTRGDGLLPLHRGVFGLAARLGVDVVPVRVRYDAVGLAWVGDATFLPHYLRFAGREHSLVHLRFGAALTSAGRAPEALAEAAREAIEAL